VETLNFERFIGIDWSGAENPGRGLQVAQCFQDNAVPQIVLKRESLNWRRRDLLDWLVQINRQGERIIVGIDFAFAYPYCDEKAYFPGHEFKPKDVKSLWNKIDFSCQEAPDFYGGPFYKSQNAPFSDYLLYQKYKGKKYSNRMRITDNRCAKLAGNPSSVFKCVGPESVGSGSVAGMRLLHHISLQLNTTFLIWPFQRDDNARSLIVEIFPRFFFKLAEVNPREWRNRDTVNNALEFFGSDILPSNVGIESEDQIDAIISAAAIRHLAGKPNSWQPSGLNECARAYEGWIFGVV
jgi:hypothetical protein